MQAESSGDAQPILAAEVLFDITFKLHLPCDLLRRPRLVSVALHDVVRDLLIS